MKKETFDLCIKLMARARARSAHTLKAAEMILVHSDYQKAMEIIKAVEREAGSNYFRRNLRGFCNRVWLKHQTLYVEGIVDEMPSPKPPAIVQ